TRLRSGSTRWRKARLSRRCRGSSLNPSSLGVLTPLLASNGPWRLFPWSQHASDNRRVQLVLSLYHTAVVVLHAQYKHRQRAFFLEVFLRDGNRQHVIQVALAICGFVAVASDVPGENADPVIIERHAIFGFGQDHQILRDSLVTIRNLIQHKESDDALTLGILRDLKRRIDVEHAPQDPAHVSLSIANQPPVFHRRGY